MLWATTPKRSALVQSKLMIYFFVSKNTKPAQIIMINTVTVMPAYNASLALAPTAYDCNKLFTRNSLNDHETVSRP